MTLNQKWFYQNAVQQTFWIFQSEELHLRCWIPWNHGMSSQFCRAQAAQAPRMTSSHEWQWTWTREGSKSGTGDGTRAGTESFLSKAFAHKKELTAFLQALKENQQQFEDWIEQVRKDNFPRKEGGEGEGAEICAEYKWISKNGALGDFHKPLNEIKASRTCATLVRRSVCETKLCWRHMVSLWVQGTPGSQDRVAGNCFKSPECFNDFGESLRCDVLPTPTIWGIFSRQNFWPF